jgi:hypothetical protein
MQGWFKVYRDLFDKPIWLDSTPEQKTVLMALVSMANHQEKQWEWEGKPYKVKPGQFITSLESIVKKCGKGVSIQNVRTSLKRFEKYEFLTNQSTNKNRLITLVNWGVYQGNEEELTSSLTGNQQATNRQLTTNKNEKKERMKRKKDSSPKRVYDETSIYYKLASLLYEEILKNIPDKKKPNLNQWADDFRKLVELDEKKPEHIETVIKWTQANGFWWKNVLSASKFREQYERLAAEVRAEKQKKSLVGGTAKANGVDFMKIAEDPRDG